MDGEVGCAIGQALSGAAMNRTALIGRQVFWQFPFFCFSLVRSGLPGCSKGSPRAELATLAAGFVTPRPFANVA